MASSISTVLSARIPNEEAAAFRAQAARFGLRPSQALEALIAGHLAVEQEHKGDGERAEGDRR